VWSLSGQVTYLLTAVATTISWAVYLVLHDYQIFTTIFTLQVGIIKHAYAG
jgi:hypothetical protein